MKEKYDNEVPKILRLLGAWRVNKDSIDFKWGYFAPKFGFEFVINRGTYFSQNYALSFAFGWGKFMVYLPLKTKLEEGCDMPRYGIHIHDDTLWIYIGGKYEHGQTQKGYISWYLPFFSYEFDGHWIKAKSNNWVNVSKNYFEFKESGQAYKETHLYTYTLKSGEVQKRNATCTIEKRKWHRKWLPFLTITRQVIDIEFSDEVGEGSGSWKGGTIGCSYDMLQNETIETCLRRMEREREFR